MKFFLFCVILFVSQTIFAATVEERLNQLEKKLQEIQLEQKDNLMFKKGQDGYYLNYKDLQIALLDDGTISLKSKNDIQIHSKNNLNLSSNNTMIKSHKDFTLNSTILSATFVRGTFKSTGVFDIEGPIIKFNNGKNHIAKVGGEIIIDNKQKGKIAPNPDGTILIP